MSLWLLARMLQWLRKKLSFDAPKVGTPALTIGPGCSHRNPFFARERIASDGQESSHLVFHYLHGDEQGKEPSKAYRQDLTQRVDATHVNV